MSKPVFISYSSKDKDVAFAVAAAIEGAGVDVWIAPRDVTLGLAYGESIIDAINASRLLVVLLSSNSNTSLAVQKEVERAVSKGLIIIPMRIEEILPTKAMEFFLSSEHWLDAWLPPLDQHLRHLAQVVQSLASVDFEPDRVYELSGMGSASGRAAASRQAAQLLGGAQRSRMWLRRTALSALLGLPVSGAAWLLLRPYLEPAAPPAPAPNSAALAVLPFENIARNNVLEYLSLAIPTELNAWLTNDADLVVRPLESVRAYGKNDIARVAQALRVGTLVTGGFWGIGTSLRVSMSIVDPGRGRVVWSRTVPGTEAKISVLMTRMIEEVGTGLRARMRSKPNQPALGTKTAEAYNLYLRAQALKQDVTDANIQAAINFLRRAIGLDRNFARAHAALAEAIVTRYWWNFTQDRSTLATAEAIAREAVRIDPQAPEAQYALGYAAEANGRRSEAVRAYFTALRNSPNCLPVLDSVARYLFYMTNYSACIKTLDRIATIDPTHNVHVRKAMCHYFSGNKTGAARENQIAERKAHGVDQLTLVAFTYVWLRDFTSAERCLAALIALDPNAFSIQEVRAWLFTMRGDIVQAREQMNRLISQRSEFGIDDEIATLYAVQGDVEHAVEWLAQAVGAGAPNNAWYSSDFFQAARSDARYQAIIADLAAEYRTDMSAVAALAPR